MSMTLAQEAAEVVRENLKNFPSLTVSATNVDGIPCCVVQGEDRLGAWSATEAFLEDSDVDAKARNLSRFVLEHIGQDA